MGRPKPFQNPRIEIVSEWIGTKKTWMDVTPDRISVGDMIISKGKVAKLLDRQSFQEDFDYVTRYGFQMLSGQKLFFDGEDPVRAFTQGVSPWPAQ